MILKEEIIEKEASKIEKKIRSTLKKAGSMNAEYKIMGTMDITGFFYRQKDFINENDIKITFNYNFEYEGKEIKSTSINKNEIIIILFGKKERVIPSLYHEITHVIDILKSKLNSPALRKSYKNIAKRVKEGKPPSKEFIPAFYSHVLEFNTLINTIAKNYRTNENYKTAFNNVKNYEELLELIFYNKQVEISKHALNDETFKRKLYLRLIKENLVPGYLKKRKEFSKKVKSFL
jgi:hypothetical protein